MSEKTFYQRHLKGKSNDELLNEFSHTTDANTTNRNALLMTFTNNSVNDIKAAIQNLTKSINKNSDTNQKLSVRLIYLNVILTILTLIMLIFTVLNFFN